MLDAVIAGKKREARLQVIAFSSEVDTGSREENAKQKALDDPAIHPISAVVSMDARARPRA